MSLRTTQRKNKDGSVAQYFQLAHNERHPESKLGVWDRWLETVYLPECNDFKLHQMYEAMDILHEHAEQIEQQVFFQVANQSNPIISLSP